ncbi:MAG: hypothetical protein IKE22_00500 [Atopobiaceae bacterium]|nr:hypothetical protein [Atopobiaceae bacterium]
MMKSIEELREEIRILKQNHIDTDELVRIADAIEREVEECYIELPMDADDDVWHVDDLVVGEVNPNNPKRVERMLWYGPDSGWQLETDSILYTCPERSRHYEPPTVEDVLREFANLVRNEELEQSRISDETIAEYAARLRLREEDDE